MKWNEKKSLPEHVPFPLQEFTFGQTKDVQDAPPYPEKQVQLLGPIIFGKNRLKFLIF